MAHPEHPFTQAVIARLFRPWQDSNGIVLAVSGGPDSTALMLMAAQWAAELAAAPPLCAATVDHGLRESSPREAQMVSGWAAALALPHAILAWEGRKPKSRIQELARKARYELLFDHAARTGASCVMTAHHADDQAETILFRLLRGSGIAGLAGMPMTSERNNLTLARPLLKYSKAQLAAFCAERAHPFIADPSNDDPAFARTRLRTLLGVLAQYGLDRAALLKLGRRAARAEAALGGRARAVGEQLRARREPGHFEADVSALAGEPEEIVLRILASELELAGSGRPPRLERLEALTGKLLQALRAGAAYKAAIGGTVVQLKSSQTLAIVKEGARRRGRGIALAASGKKVRHGSPGPGNMQVSLGKGGNQA